MNIVTWNVNSIRSREAYVRAYLEETAPDVLCIQELKAMEDQIPMSLFEDLNYHTAIHGQKSWNGVMIASKKPISDVVKGFPGEENGDARFIKATVDGIPIVNLYCPQGQSAESPKFAYKKRFYQALIKWVSTHCLPEEPWILTGDFNIAPDACDVWDVEQWQGVPTYHPDEHELWSELLKLGFEDVGRPHMKAGVYTFWDYRRIRFPRNQGLRIDHFLGGKQIATRVELVEVHRDWRKKRGELKASDHAPVLLRLS